MQRMRGQNAPGVPGNMVNSVRPTPPQSKSFFLCVEHWEELDLCCILAVCINSL